MTVPPRHGKSLLCSTFLPAWLLGRDPAAQVIRSRYGQDLATSFGRQVRNLMASEPYAAVFTAPISPDSRAVDEFRTAAGGSYIARGIGGGVTGYGGDLIIVDDPYRNRQDADSDLVRAQVLEYYRSTLYTRLMPGGSIVLILTRWHHDDLVGRLLAESGEAWEVVRFPALDEAGRALWAGVVAGGAPGCDPAGGGQSRVVGAVPGRALARMSGTTSRPSGSGITMRRRRA